MERVLASFSRSPRNILRVLETEFEGRQLVDVRVWYRIGDGPLQPTKKGLSVRREEFPAFVELMQEAQAALDQEEVVA